MKFHLLLFNLVFLFLSSDRPYDVSKKRLRLETRTQAKKNAVPGNFPRFYMWIHYKKCLSIYRSHIISFENGSLCLSSWC